MKKSQEFYLPIKRLLDIFGSIVGIVFCLGLLWWWIFIINLFVTKGHPIFLQERYGKNKKVFKIFKFRSMKIDADPNLAPSDINKETQESMETKFGRFLRKSSFDETLQLLNILIGQMSFIGPRPGAVVNEDYLIVCREKFTPNAFVVKPGISGYAQVKMSRLHDPNDKAYFDHIYVKRISFLLDTKIFFLTICGIFGILKGK